MNRATTAMKQMTKKIPYGVVAPSLSILINYSFKYDYIPYQLRRNPPYAFRGKLDTSSLQVVSVTKSFLQCLQSSPCFQISCQYIFTFRYSSSTQVRCLSLDSCAATLFLILCYDLGSFLLIFFVFYKSTSSYVLFIKWNLKPSSWFFEQRSHLAFLICASLRQQVFLSSPSLRQLSGIMLIIIWFVFGYQSFLVFWLRLSLSQICQ